MCSQQYKRSSCCRALDTLLLAYVQDPGHPGAGGDWSGRKLSKSGVVSSFFDFPSSPQVSAFEHLIAHVIEDLHMHMFTAPMVLSVTFVGDKGSWAIKPLPWWGMMAPPPHPSKRQHVTVNQLGITIFNEKTHIEHIEHYCIENDCTQLERHLVDFSRLPFQCLCPRQRRSHATRVAPSPRPRIIRWSATNGIPRTSFWRCRSSLSVVAVVVVLLGVVVVVVAFVAVVVVVVVVVVVQWSLCDVVCCLFLRCSDRLVRLVHMIHKTESHIMKMFYSPNCCCFSHVLLGQQSTII